MLKCVCCGRRFSKPATYREMIGECHGFPAYRPMLACPYCGGGYQYEDGYCDDLYEESGGEDDYDDEDEGDDRK